MTDAIKHEARTHSKLGASKADRWMNCPGSVRMSEGIHETSSIFADEGTAAHELADKCLVHGFDAERFIGETIVVKNNVFTVDEEMAEAVQEYLDHVRALASEPRAQLFVEKGFDLSFVQEGMYGTNDASVYLPETRTLHVIDYKHGKGYAVDVHENPQLKYYGVGAVADLEAHGFGVENVVITVAQPRAHHRDGAIRSYEIDAMDLIGFINELREAAVATLDPNAPLKAGDWCKFCPAAGFCPQLHNQAIEAAKLEFAPHPDHMTPQQLAEVLDQATLVENWMRSVWAFAQNTVDTGGEVPGWKLVRGTSRRKWATEDHEALIVTLEDEYALNENELVAPRKIKTPAQIEKMLPKDMRAAFSDRFTEKPPGKATLARIEDPRAELAGGQSAARDFDVIHDDEPNLF